jgi:hypothetical protein
MVVDVEMTRAIGTAEVQAVLRMVDTVGGDRRITAGGNKKYDQHPFVDACRTMNVTPHVAQKKRSAIDGRTSRHAGYAVSENVRKWAEDVFGWDKTVGGLRKLRCRGVKRAGLRDTFTVTAFNPVRMVTLERAATVPAA